MIIYYNPKCSTCQKTLALLKEKDFEVEVREYLNDPLDRNEILDLLYKLGISASELLRRKGDIWDNLLEKHGEPSEEESLQWIIDNPVLMQRPIVVNNGMAKVCRPFEKVLEIL